MTRTLLFITFSFLILLAWQCITQCFWMLGYGKHDRTQPDTWKMVDSSFALAKLGVIINSSINWIFYCFTCSMFRKEMRKLFGLKKNFRESHSKTDSWNMSSVMTKNSSLSTNSESLVIKNTNLLWMVISQMAHDVRMVLQGRWNDAKTLKRRRNNVVRTSFVG